MAIVVLATLASVATGFGVASGQGIEGARFRVTVTNLTRGQILSPAVVASHSSQLPPVFSLGSPASSELAAVAEDADNAPLVAALSRSRHVKDVRVMRGPIPPGGSASITVAGGRGGDHLSVVGMLVTTNDAFYGVSGLPGPRGGSLAHVSVGYDAGSEDNNEKCQFIPGPPCGHPFVRDPEGAEGYVHVHAGIHGIADLVPARDDWRNPVALITIDRR